MLRANESASSPPSHRQKWHLDAPAVEAVERRRSSHRSGRRPEQQPRRVVRIRHQRQQLVDELAGHRGLSLAAGTVYPLLARLLRSKLIASTWQESPVGPPRKYYRLTPAGTAALAAMADAWAQVRTTLDAILKESR